MWKRSGHFAMKYQVWIDLHQLVNKQVKCFDPVLFRDIMNIFNVFILLSMAFIATCKLYLLFFWQVVPYFNTCYSRRFFETSPVLLTTVPWYAVYFIWIWPASAYQKFDVQEQRITHRCEQKFNRISHCMRSSIKAEFILTIFIGP